MEGDLMGCNGFFVDRRDLEERNPSAYALRGHWATVENGKRLMDMWMIARRDGQFERKDERDWRALESLAEVAYIGGRVAPVDLSKIEDVTYELPMSIGDMMEESDYSFMIIMDWKFKSVQEYSLKAIEEIYYWEDEE